MLVALQSANGFQASTEFGILFCQPLAAGALERDHAMLLDFDLRVEAFGSQPFWL